MAQARGIKPVGYFDCPGGGQVVVSGTTVYVAHMKAPHGTTVVDVSDYLDRKRAAMAAHASQISEQSFFLAMPPEPFAMAFGTEWFIRRGASPGAQEADLFTGLD